MMNNVSRLTKPVTSPSSTSNGTGKDGRGSQSMKYSTKMEYHSSTGTSAACDSAWKNNQRIVRPVNAENIELVDEVRR